MRFLIIMLLGLLVLPVPHLLSPVPQPLCYQLLWW
jgi:hypothetical protein